MKSAHFEFREKKNKNQKQNAVTFLRLRRTLSAARLIPVGEKQSKMKDKITPPAILSKKSWQKMKFFVFDRQQMIFDLNI